MKNDMKIVHYDEYCKSCEFEKSDDSEEPCNDCLYEPVNTNSHKPVNWKEKNK